MTDFHILYERYSPQVRKLALFLSGDPALADDITSETFVRAWTTRGPIREETVKAYLFTIARNLYYDSLRRTRRQVSLDESLPDGRAGAQKQTEVRTELQMVLKAMQELSVVDRTALLMRAQEEMSYEEISRALGLSLAAVRVKIHRARLKLMRATRSPGRERHGSEKNQ